MATKPASSDIAKTTLELDELKKWPLAAAIDLDDIPFMSTEDLDTDFAVSALQNLSKVIRTLTTDHNRRMRALRTENKDMQSKLEAAGLECNVMREDNCGLQAPVEEPAATPATPAASSFSPASGNIPGSDWIRGLEGDGQGLEAQRERSESLKEDVGVNAKEAQRERSESGGGDPGLQEPSGELVRTASQEELEGPLGDGCLQRMHRLVLSPKFDSIIGSVIIANTLVMSLQLEYNGRVFKDEVLDACQVCDVRSQVIEGFFANMEHIFTGVFTLELLVRLCFIGCRYFRSVANALDLVVVIVSMVDSWVLGPMGSNVLGSVAVLRLIRLLRLAKILRVVRVMKAFRSLRVLVAAVVNSVGALGWSMTLLFVLELVGAIFMAQVIQPFMEDATGTEEAKELQSFIWHAFGTWTNAMFTIFEITMAPGGFIKYRRLYEEVHPLFGMFFVVYVCVVTFAVVRVITAMFLKATLSASDSEEQETQKDKQAEWSAYMKTVKAQTNASRGSECLTFEELADLFKIEQFASHIEESGMSQYEVTRMFQALDQGSNTVLFAEFENAVKQMSGLPRASHFALNLYETQDILRRVMIVESKLGGSPVDLERQKKTKLDSVENIEYKSVKSLTQEAAAAF